MAKGKQQREKQYDGQKKTTKGQTIKWSKVVFPGAIILFVLLFFSVGHYIFSPFVVYRWSLYCLSFCRFPLAIILFCPFVVFLWPLYCLSFCRFPLTIILFVLLWFFLWPLYCLSFRC
jgi:hypothetical protein